MVRGGEKRIGRWRWSGKSSRRESESESVSEGIREDPPGSPVRWTTLVWELGMGVSCTWRSMVDIWMELESWAERPGWTGLIGFISA